MAAISYLFSIPPVVEECIEEKNTTAFSIGSSPVNTLRRRERLAVAKEKRAKKAKKIPTKKSMYLSRRFISSRKGAAAYINSSMPKFILREKRWLLSERGVPMTVTNFLYAAGENYQQIYKAIIRKKRVQNNYFSIYDCYISSEPSIPVLNIYMKFAMRNQRIRNAFGALARRWLRAKLTTKNTEDLMTGEPAVNSITLIDWPTRSKYVFEARTILRDMTSRLMISIATFFPSPKPPRNPYTNEVLTEGQFYSIVQQLRKAGETHWALEALYSAKYKMKEFDRDMYTKLKRTIHNSVFANPSTDAAKDILLEFIEDEHLEHNIPYEKDIYVWATEKQSAHYKLHEWRVQCSKFYTIQHFPSDSEFDTSETEKVHASTKKLCVYPFTLVKKYDAAHEDPYIKMADRIANTIPDSIQTHVYIPTENIHINYISVDIVQTQHMAAIIAAFQLQEEAGETETEAETETDTETDIDTEDTIFATTNASLFDSGAAAADAAANAAEESDSGADADKEISE